MGYGPGRRRRRIIGFTVPAVFAALILVLPAAAFAADDGPPLPLHTIEGVGGVLITPTAYLVNPGPEGTTVGKPALGTAVAFIGQKDLEAVTLTCTLWRQLELGYGFNRLGLGDLPRDIRAATTVDIGTHDVHLHHFNARLNVIPENHWGKNWVPAVTVGAHYKYNEDINGIDRRLGGALSGIGLKDNDGLDFTLTATKAITSLPRHVLLSLGARASKGAQLGLLGFTDDYHVTLEGSALVFLTNRLVVGAEYRQKRSQLGRIPGLIGREHSWWTLCGAYVINDNMTIAGAFGDLGTVANHKDEKMFGLAFKCEF